MASFIKTKKEKLSESILMLIVHFHFAKNKSQQLWQQQAFDSTQVQNRIKAVFVRGTATKAKKDKKKFSLVKCAIKKLKMFTSSSRRETQSSSTVQLAERLEISL